MKIQKEIIPIQNQTNVDKQKDSLADNNLVPKSSFLLEKHLEDYIIKNWANIELNEDYDIHRENLNVHTIFNRFRTIRYFSN